MEVCNKCGEERDGNNICDCVKKKISKANRKSQRQLKDAMLRDMGMKKVKGSLGGTYWE